MKLVASGGKSEVTVYGTTQGVRADAQIGRSAGTATNALPALANIDPPRMFQFQVRFLF